MKLASFDIFDTTLIRLCGRPENIFHLLAHRLFADDESQRSDFISWRLRAERQANQRLQGKDPELADIYSGDDLLSFLPYSPEQLAEADRQTEADNLRANPAVRDLIGRLRTEGYTICFISDMYLDAAFLHSILMREGCAEAGDTVYVSCDCNARKSSGALFRHVAKLLHPDEWLHFGDNKHSDVKMARRQGIKATLINTDFSAVEKRIIDKSRKLHHNYELSILAGYTRAVRIMSGCDRFVSMAADFVAPAYIPYVDYVLKDARKQGIEKLYFLSRDSYVLMRCAEQLGSNAELHYLFVSRKALIPAYLDEPYKESFLSILDHKTLRGKYIDDLLPKLSTDRNELHRDYAIEFGYSRIQTDAEESDFCRKMFDSPFTDCLRRRNNERRRMAMQYFEQEGIDGKSKAAMVDVGWLGTTRQMINSLLDKEGKERVEFYYYGVRGDVLHNRFGRYKAYFGSNELPSTMTTLIENYFSASPYPSVAGYKETAGVIEPQFKGSAERIDNRITHANIEAVEAVSRLIAESGLDFSPVFRLWAMISNRFVFEVKKGVDVGVLAESYDFDGTAFVRRLNAKELLLLLLSGKHVTAFDRASVALTCRRRLGNMLWLISSTAGRLRNKLYLRKLKHRIC